MVLSVDSRDSDMESLSINPMRISPPSVSSYRKPPCLCYLHLQELLKNLPWGFLPRVQGKPRPSGTSTTDRPGWFHRLRYHGSRLSSSYYCKCPSRMLSVITQHCCLQSSHSRTLGYRLERWYSSQEYALTVLSGNLSA